MRLDTRVSDHQRFVSKVLKQVQQTALKYSQVSDTEQLVCTDSKFVLQRKLTKLSRRGNKGKLAFFHGFDVMVLFQDIIRDIIIKHYSTEYTVDVFIVADLCPNVTDRILDILMDAQVRLFMCHSMTSLMSKINSGKSEKKLILNFDKTVAYLPCDLFMYFGLNLNPSEMRTLFKLSMTDSLGPYVVIDTVPQRIQKHTKFVTKDTFRISVSSDLAYFVLKNCAVAGKAVGDAMTKIIFDTATNSPSAMWVDTDSEEEVEEDDEGGVAAGIQRVISDQLAVFVDREADNYLLEFMREHIGTIKTLHPVSRAWSSLTDCTPPVKMVCFVYIRTIPDFRDIALFCNAFKVLHPEANDLIVMILVSPSLEKATADSLRQYRADFNALVTLATSTTCCSGLHCEETLLRQYMMPSDCGCASSEAPVQYEEVTWLLLAIFEAMDHFVRHRTLNFNPVFHEQELVQAVNARVSSDLNVDLVASFLKRAIPFTAKDGTMKVVTRFFDKPGLFIVKNDFQKYINVSTMTGVDFNSPVGDRLQALYEEYKEE